MKNIEVRSNASAPFLTRRLLQSLVLGLTLALAGAAGHAAQSVTLAWDPSPDFSVGGYYVHYGTTSQGYSELVDAGNATAATVSGLASGQTYFFAVTAYNQQRIESAPSGEIAYTVPAVTPSPVTGVLRILRGAGLNSLPRLQFLVPPTHQYEVQASQDLQSWKTIHRNVSVSTNWIDFTDPQAAYMPKRFYRLALPDKPRIPGIISILRCAARPGAIRLRPVVAQGQRYAIQASQDMTTWTTLHEGICTSTEPMDFVDSQAGLFPKRFYRLSLPDTPSTPSLLRIFRGVGANSAGHLRLSVMAGEHYRVQASQDLTSWATVYEGISHSTEPVDLIDPEAGLLQKRFYRLAFD